MVGGAMATDSASTRISAGTPAYRRLALALVIAGLSTFALLYSVQSLLPIFAREFHVSAAESSLVVLLATGAMALMLLFASVVSDRVGCAPDMIVEGVTGTYFEDCQPAGPVAPGVRRGVADYALDPEKAARLWQVSLDLLAAAWR